MRNFFGSKLNTVLFLVLSIFVVFTLGAILKDKIIRFSFSDGIKVYQDDGHGNEADWSEKYPSNKRVMSFLKGLVKKYPNSQIRECATVNNDLLFSLYKDTSVADDKVTFYDKFGVELDVCGGHSPEDPESLCSKTSCKVIYYNTDYKPNINNIDIHNLK
jgi:hypothetical protein